MMKRYFLLVYLAHSIFLCSAQNDKLKNYLFKESLVTELTPWSCVEESENFPDNFTFPAFVGSGNLFYGLDASGFQSINFDLASRYIPSNGSTADDLYFFHKGMHSNHLNYDDLGKYPVNQMPLGYITFSILIDGYRLSPGILINTATNWKRITDFRKGLLETSYTLSQGIRLVITHILLPGTTVPFFSIKAESADGKPHKVDLRIELKLRTRYGARLWDDKPDVMEASPEGSYLAASVTKDGAFQAAGDYDVKWGLFLKGGIHKIDSTLSEYQGYNVFSGQNTKLQPTSEKARKYTLTAETALQVEINKTAETNFMLYLGNKNQENPKEVLHNYASISTGDLIKLSEQKWGQHFHQMATVNTNNPTIDFLYHRSLYLLTAGIAFEYGAPPSFQFVAGSPWWSGSSFHDSWYIFKGLTGSNAGNECKHLFEWCRDFAWQKEERPLYWLTRYDGFPITRYLTEGEDQGFLVMTSLGLIPVIYASSFTRDPHEILQAYNMLKALVEYFQNHILTLAGEQYFLKIAVENDVTPDVAVRKTSQDAFLLMTMKTLFRKCNEMALQLNIDKEKRALWLDIAERLYQPKDNDGFLLSQDNGSRAGGFISWFPFFCIHPNDLKLPQPQIELWKNAYKGNGGQAWEKFVASASSLQWHDAEVAKIALNKGIENGTYGSGYFSEFFLREHTWRSASQLVNLPPFATAHGSYLAAINEIFLRSNIWNDTISICPLAGSLTSNTWQVSNLRSLDGLVMSACSDSTQLKVMFKNERQKRYFVEIKYTAGNNQKVMVKVNNRKLMFLPRQPIIVQLSGNTEEKITVSGATNMRN